MAVSDDDGTAERLAQVRAQRRHLRRLRTAERRDGAHEREAEAAAEREAEAEHERFTAPPAGSGDTRRLLLAEEAALELERASLAADRELGPDMEM